MSPAGPFPRGSHRSPQGEGPLMTSMPIPEAASGTVTLSIGNHVATVTLNRPAAMNAIDLATEAELQRIWTQIENDPDVRLVVLTGAGERAFCAGADLKNPSVTGLEYWAAPRPGGFGGIALRETLHVPVIARVNGFALGDHRHVECLAQGNAAETAWPGRGPVFQAGDRRVLEVGAGAESAVTGAGEHHQADLGVALDLYPDALQFGFGRQVDGVHRRGAVQRDGGDVVLDGQGHRPRSRFRHRHGTHAGAPLLASARISSVCCPSRGGA